MTGKLSMGVKNRLPIVNQGQYFYVSKQNNLEFDLFGEQILGTADEQQSDSSNNENCDVSNLYCPEGFVFDLKTKGCIVKTCNCENQNPSFFKNCQVHEKECQTFDNQLNEFYNGNFKQIRANFGSEEQPEEFCLTASDENSMPVHNPLKPVEGGFSMEYTLTWEVCDEIVEDEAEANTDTINDNQLFKYNAQKSQIISKTFNNKCITPMPINPSIHNPLHSCSTYLNNQKTGTNLFLETCQDHYVFQRFKIDLLDNKIKSKCPHGLPIGKVSNVSNGGFYAAFLIDSGSSMFSSGEGLEVSFGN